MSAESIARWNAIPMERPLVEHDSNSNTLKRSRDAMDEDDNDDNVSLVSRTPSPPPPDRMDVDKYDEYNRGIEREVITVDTKISSNNKGFAMLAKLGWIEGQPLGLSADGRVDPVPFVMKNDFTGLGKTTQDVRMIETTVSQRRELDSERQTKETENQRKTREENVAKRHAVQSEISSVLRPFYCELCDKQFQNVAQYDEHTNSYAHHHKARLRDMQAAQRASFASDGDKRKEKEKKREEKELRKIAKAAGIKMPKQTPALAPLASDSSVGLQGTEQAHSVKGGWATVGSSSSQSTAGAIVAGSPSTGGWASVSQFSNVSSTPRTNATPMFHTGGWASLDASSSQPPGPAQSLPSPRASLPSLTSSGGWSAVSASTHTPALEHIPPAHTTDKGGWPNVAQLEPTLTAQSGTAPVIQPAQPPHELPSAVIAAAKPAAQRQEAARSGWQQFKTGGPRRR
ncbi:hypothetical protein BDY19DRAFT_964910 [Irpex rosettiformis]|uniref:Uncharacterized protein n=1 Tax=Irpex rosettiformis TaxID=378272 RepID=A0ACB8TUQ0_9APHY|nr:hypothetical protein BDY19DRAFT_964910 [Irpex rosettiformis]